MIHWPIHPHSLRHYTSDKSLLTAPPALAEACDALRRLQEAGKIRHIGVSNFGPVPLAAARECGLEMAANQLPYSLLTRAIEFDALPRCQAEGIGVIGYMTLMQGILADKYDSLENIPSQRRRTRHFRDDGTGLSRHGGEGAEADMQQALHVIRDIAQEQEVSMLSLAVRWAIAREGITCALIGARNLAQLEEQVEAAEEPLPEDLVTRLNEATKPLQDALGPGFDYFESLENDRTCL
jgi:aryl-alcohol dehydrogenase-like predicted oxidoreductase